MVDRIVARLRSGRAVRGSESSERLVNRVLDELFPVTVGMDLTHIRPEIDLTNDEQIVGFVNAPPRLVAPIRMGVPEQFGERNVGDANVVNGLDARINGIVQEPQFLENLDGILGVAPNVVQMPDIQNDIVADQVADARIMNNQGMWSSSRVFIVEFLITFYRSCMTCVGFSSRRYFDTDDE